MASWSHHDSADSRSRPARPAVRAARPALAVARPPPAWRGATEPPPSTGGVGSSPRRSGSGRGGGGQAGAALGGPPSQPPSAARTCRPSVVVEPGRLAVVDRRAPRARRRPARRSSTRWSRRAARRAAACRARRSPGSASDRCASAARAGTTARGRERYGGRVRCPYCRENDDKVVDSRVADDGAAIRRRRECLGVRPPVHHLRAGRGARRCSCAKRSGVRRAVRPGQARGRASSGPWPDRLDRRGDGRRARRRGRGGAAGRGRRGRERAGRPGRPRAAAGPRPGRRTCASPRSTRASRTSPTSSARSSSSRRRPRPKRRVAAAGGSGRPCSRARVRTSRTP